MALYVKFAQEKRPRTVKLFLKQFYSGRKDPYIAYAGRTYTDSECRNLHCDRSYRSFDDLLNMINTYYPSITAKKLMHHLLTIKIPVQGKPDEFYTYHLATCSGMGRIRYIPYYQKFWDPNQIDRRMPNSRYTWSELLAKLGITNEKEFHEYIEKHR